MFSFISEGVNGWLWYNGTMGAFVFSVPYCVHEYVDVWLYVCTCVLCVYGGVWVCMWVWVWVSCMCMLCVYGGVGVWVGVYVGVGVCVMHVCVRVSVCVCPQCLYVFAYLCTYVGVNCVHTPMARCALVLLSCC